MIRLRIGGLKVVDAKRNATFRINDREAKNGKPKDPQHCAAAMACIRTFKAKDVRVHLTRTYVRNNGYWTRYFTPGSLRSEIIAIDRGGKFMPGTHTLMAVPKYRLLGTKKNTGPKKTKGKKRRTLHIVANVRSGAPR